MNESSRVAMKNVASGKALYVTLDNGKVYWVDTAGNKLPTRGYHNARLRGWLRMEELDNPPAGTKHWYRVLLSSLGREAWTGVPQHEADHA